MLSKSLNSDVPKYIPYTNERYSITKNGTVKDVSAKIVLNPSPVDRVTLFILNELRTIEVNWLIAITFKPVYDAASFILNWSVLVINDEKEIEPENLVWKPPVDGQPAPNFPGFYVIPGFSQYAISKDNDDVIIRGKHKHVTNRKFTPGFKLSIKKVGKKQENSYLGYDVQTDSGYLTTVGVHRLKGLAFKEYTSNVNRLVVNHLDGDKRNTELYNLEWATYSENNKHALINGLNGSYVKVLVKDYITDTITEYPSLSKCSTDMNIAVGSIITSELKDNPSRYPYKYRYAFRRETSDKPFYEWDKEILLSNIEKMKHTEEKNVYWIKHIHTGKIDISDNRVVIGRIAGLDKEQVRTIFKSKELDKFYVNDHMFGYLTDSDPELASSENRIERKLLRRPDNFKGSNDCWAFNIETRELILGTSAIHIAKKLNIDYDTVRREISYDYHVYPCYGHRYGTLKNKHLINEIREYGKDEIEFFKNVPKLRTVIRVTKRDLSYSKLFSTKEEVIKYLDITDHEYVNHISNNKTDEGHYTKGYIVTIIKP